MNKTEREKLRKAKEKARATVIQKKEEKKQRGSFTKPGVIAYIQEIIEKNGPITKDDVHKELCKKFKDRDADKMRKTVNCQIGGKKRPLRMEKEKGIKFFINDKDEFAITTKTGKKSKKK